MQPHPSVQPALQCTFTASTLYSESAFSCATAVQLRQKDLELQLAEVRRKESEEVARDFQVRATELLAAPVAPPAASTLSLSGLLQRGTCF